MNFNNEITGEEQGEGGVRAERPAVPEAGAELPGATGDDDGPHHDNHPPSDSKHYHLQNS